MHPAQPIAPSTPPTVLVRPTVMSTDRAARGERALALLVCIGCLSILAVAAWLEPSGDGAGTHTQLGLPPCGWASRLGRPCPTCGMTTAFAYVADGDLVHAFVAQPAGFVLALGTAAGFWGSLHIAVTGSRLGRIGARMLRPWWLWSAAGMVAAAWVYKLVTWPAT